MNLDSGSISFCEIRGEGDGSQQRHTLITDQKARPSTDDELHIFSTPITLVALPGDAIRVRGSDQARSRHAEPLASGGRPVRPGEAHAGPLRPVTTPLSCGRKRRTPHRARWTRERRADRARSGRSSWVEELPTTHLARVWGRRWESFNERAGTGLSHLERCDPESRVDPRQIARVRTRIASCRLRDRAGCRIRNRPAAKPTER